MARDKATSFRQRRERRFFTISRHKVATEHLLPPVTTRAAAPPPRLSPSSRHFHAFVDARPPLRHVIRP